MMRMRKKQSMTTTKRRSCAHQRIGRMLIPKTAAYGSWKSRVSSDLIAAQSISLSEPRLDGQQVYWLEGRPQELGRYVVVRASSLGGRGTDVTPRPYNAAHARP